MAHRTTGSDELIGRVPCEARRSETRSNVFLSHAAQSGSRTDRIFPDTRTRSRARSLRSCAPHTLVSALSRRAADADREPGPARIRRTHPRARSGVVPAVADRHRRPVPPLVSAPAHSDLLRPSPASARQSAETGARDSKTVIPLQTAPDSVPGVLSSSACANSRFPSRVLGPCVFLVLPRAGLPPVHERSLWWQKQAVFPDL